jgi:hypothetical protein
MSTKKQRREAAQKRAKKKRITTIAILSVCAVAIIVVFTVYALTRPDSRVFSVPGNQSVTLYENGRFSARLAHNVNFSGTFTEEVSENVTEISFTHNGNTVITQIENNVLLLPETWRATCRAHNHEIEFPLSR